MHTGYRSNGAVHSAWNLSLCNARTCPAPIFQHYYTSTYSMFEWAPTASLRSGFFQAVNGQNSHQRLSSTLFEATLKSCIAADFGFNIKIEAHTPVLPATIPLQGANKFMPRGTITYQDGVVMNWKYIALS